MLLKKGSKGDDVKKLQSFLGCTADGVFGDETARLVRIWQNKHGLTADGIVGDKTWEKMFPETLAEKYCIDPSVMYYPLSCHYTKRVGRKIEYIVIHYTAGSTSKPGKAKSMRDVFEKHLSSADFGIDDKYIVQFNPDIRNCYCWAVGDVLKKSVTGGKLSAKASNTNTIHIELCSTCSPSTQEAVSHPDHLGWSFTDSVIDNAVRLTKMLMKEYNIDADHVVRHYDITGKHCPGVPGWIEEPVLDIHGKKTGKQGDSKSWLAFKQRLL